MQNESVPPNGDASEVGSVKADDSSLAGISSIEEYYNLPEQAVQAVQHLRKVSKNLEQEDMIIRALKDLHHLCRTTYNVRSVLGAADACAVVLQLLQRVQDREVLVLECFRIICLLLDGENANKLIVGSLGGCELIVRITEQHILNSDIVLKFCSLVVELGNAKFPHMVDYYKKYGRIVRLVAQPSPDKRPLREGAGAASFEQDNTETINQDETFYESGEAAVQYADDAPRKELWDNRQELGDCGACGVLAELLIKYVGDGAQIDTAKETIIAAVCKAIASLAANDTCSLLFSKASIGKPLVTILSKHQNNWDLVLGSLWAMIILCSDRIAGNRPVLGDSHAIERIYALLSDLIERHEVLSHRIGYLKLLEYLIWALLNLVIDCSHNRDFVARLPLREKVDQLLVTEWVGEGLKQKIRKLKRHSYD